MNSQKLQLKCIGAPRAPGVASVDEAGALGGCIDELDPFNGVIVGAVVELEGEALVGVLRHVIKSPFIEGSLGAASCDEEGVVFETATIFAG